MFAGCENIIKLDFISFNTFFVKNMKSMFFGCTNLKHINLLSFDTTNVMDMSYMFYNCENLINLDLSSFNNKNVIDMQYMFYGCKNLRNLNLSNFNIKMKCNYEGMFYNCNKLKDIYSSLFDKQISNDSKKNIYFKAKYLFNSQLSKSNQELIEFLLFNVEKDDNVNKKENIENKVPFIPFVLKYGNAEINSYFILISNNIILIHKNYLCDNKGEAPDSLFFPQIKESIEYSSYNFVIEKNNDNFCLIKVLNKKFLFKNYFKLPNDSFARTDIKSREKFYVNEKQKEISLGINFNDNKINMIQNYNPGSPIYIKRANQSYLIGIIHQKNKLYFFNKKELYDFKKYFENIEYKSIFS